MGALPPARRAADAPPCFILPLAEDGSSPRGAGGARRGHTTRWFLPAGAVLGQLGHRRGFQRRGGGSGGSAATASCCRAIDTVTSAGAGIERSWHPKGSVADHIDNPADRGPLQPLQAAGRFKPGVLKKCYRQANGAQVPKTVQRFELPPSVVNHKRAADSGKLREHRLEHRI